MQTATTPAAATIVPDISLADIRAICADLTREFPAAGSRVEKAANIFLFRHMERSESGCWYIQSETDPDAEYIVAGESCQCQDHQRHGGESPCKHRLSTLIADRAERLEADAGTPVDPPACICQPAHGIQCAAHGNAAARAVAAETLIDVDGEPIPYSITTEALVVLDEARQRDAARCPECNTWKQHGSLYCGGERCEAPPRWVPAIIA